MAVEQVVEPDHLQADEDEDDGEAVLEQMEQVHGAGEQEEEAAQAQDGEDVGSEDD